MDYELQERPLFTLDPAAKAALLSRFQVKEREPGQPRGPREEKITDFTKRLNVDREKAGYPPYSEGYVRKMFKEYPTGNMHLLFQECSQARQFGSLLKYKLDEYRGEKYRPPIDGVVPCGTANTHRKK